MANVCVQVYKGKKWCEKCIEFDKGSNLFGFDPFRGYFKVVIARIGIVSILNRASVQ